MQATITTVQAAIEQKLRAALNISHLEVRNESHMHAVPPNSETHFKAVIVSDDFAGKRKVARHQVIYGVLAHELANGVHALALHTYSIEEWQQLNQAPNSPACKGGSRHEL
ncbi:Putative cell division protein [gamma proteobacterium HdN1]|nr:Putative cell division protein [gamma proteobacterium HdN1]